MLSPSRVSKSAVRGPSKTSSVARAEAPGVAGEGVPGAVGLPLIERDPDPRGPAPGCELGGDDAGVVDDEQVAGAEEGRDVPDVAVLEGVANDEQPGGVARTCRMLRDAVGREGEIEVAGQHLGSLKLLPPADVRPWR